ncbi:uncharacterized protein Bfra_005271 [Botrytis fragariae]|uniref:Uncharacterized protein n=1 Tax=Botrytis fragariae TaxID=1964551 RepID=A0A8H6AUC1_9HELO|nr:uncharacterized protein Bfra_005271 [Botrytis fragariae]KAF5873804.1 hypothetical protein Bfra_005271 [Botrytis fragariae]
MDQWLRPVFARTRTPVQSATSNHSDEPHETEDTMKSIRPSSRVSSYIGFRSSTSNLHAPAGDTFTFQHVNIPENVYHKPSGSQMAETLKVIMMTRNLMEPIPVEYNTCILHVLEAYNDLQEMLAVKEGEIEEINGRHTKNIREFDGMAEQWKAKEKDYQKEIKNLEVLLSKTEGGMENVTMARSKSVVHGTRRAADLFEDGMEKIKQNFARYSSGRDSSTATTDWDLDRVQQINSSRPLETPTNASELSHGEGDIHHKRTVKSRRKESSSVQDTESFHSAVDDQSTRLTSVQLDALERQHATEELGVVFNSSSESDDTSSRSAFTEGQAPTPTRTPKISGFRNGSKEKPLPDIPTKHQEMDPFFSGETGNARPWVEPQDDGEASSSVEYRKRFSFRTGDDPPSVLHKPSKDGLQKSNTVSVPASRLSYVMNSEDEFVSLPRHPIADANSQVETNPKARNTGSKPTLSTSPGKETYATGLRQQLGMGRGMGKGIERGDSSSSIVTAVRDNSGRSEKGRPVRGDTGGKGNGSGGKQKQSQGTAVMAAVRAIAASNKSATANDRIQAHANESDRKEIDRREGVPFSPERSPTGSQVGGGRE